MTKVNICILAFVFVFVPNAFCQTTGQTNLQTVERFVAAFNQHNSAAMVAFVADEIEWLSIDGAHVVVEASGKTDLIQSMNAYFESCSTCQSSLSGVISSSDRVSAVEIASWQGANGPDSQKSLSVYEFSDGLIRRVYYFPAEKAGD